MENARGLPFVSLLIGLVLIAATWASYAARDPSGVFVLNELEIGMLAAAFSLVVFGLQGLISVLLEGERLQVGRVLPRLTNPLSVAIVVFSIALLVVSVALGFAIYDDRGPEAVGLLAGAGCLILALLLVFYKEAFVGDEARFDDREDGVPW